MQVQGRPERDNADKPVRAVSCQEMLRAIRGRKWLLCSGDLDEWAPERILGFEVELHPSASGRLVLADGVSSGFRAVPG